MANGTDVNAAGGSGMARALHKQSKCGMIQKGEGHWPSSSEFLQKARNLWVLRTPQNNKELELELIQTQMTQKPMLRAEVYARALRASQNRKEDSV